VVVITILIISLIGCFIKYTLGRLIMKYDQNIDHKIIFSSDSFNTLFLSFLIYSVFIYLFYLFIFKFLLKRKNIGIILEGLITACMAIILIETIGNHFTIVVVGLTIGKIVFYTSIFFMSILLPLFHQIIKNFFR